MAVVYTAYSEPTRQKRTYVQSVGLGGFTSLISSRIGAGSAHVCGRYFSSLDHIREHFAVAITAESGCVFEV